MADQEETPLSSPRSKRSLVLWGFTFLLLLFGILAFCYWYFYLRSYQSTDNAYANGNLITINSAISGSVIAYFADDTDLVKQGQLLVQIDPTNYQLAYEAELAKLASIVSQVGQLYDPLVEEQKLNIQKAFYRLQRCSIYAPETGYIAQRSVVVGQWINPTIHLMTLIPPEQM